MTTVAEWNYNKTNLSHSCCYNYALRLGDWVVGEVYLAEERVKFLVSYLNENPALIAEILEEYNAEM